MKNTILITGRNGFVGCALVSRLKKHYDIVSLIRNKKPNIDYSEEKLIFADIRMVSIDDLRKYHFDFIVHLASMVRGQAKFILQNNIEISQKIFQVAQECDIPVLFLSTTNVLFAEKLGAYAQSKKTCEEYLSQLNLKYVIVRVPLIIGNESSSMQLIKKFYKRFSFFPLFGPQEGKMQPVHVSSLINIIEYEIESSIISRKVVTVIGKQIYTYREILSKIIESDKVSRVRFIIIPFAVAKFLSLIFEWLKISGFISTEEIISVNMDKVLENNSDGIAVYVDNQLPVLFQNA